MAFRTAHFFRELAVLPIRIYQKLISPILPRSCIYEPSCSRYTAQAIRRFGVLKGVYLGFFRIIRCNSLFFFGGQDDVPEVFRFRETWNGMVRFCKIKKKPPGGPGRL
jgi:putative membrane protein insertion efficiency factor